METECGTNITERKENRENRERLRETGIKREIDRKKKKRGIER